MTQLLFVHLAKTGGTSVRKILKASQANSFDCVHHHTLIRFRNGERVHRGQFKPGELDPYPLAFLMVRHPVDRLISCYRYFVAGGLNAQPMGRFFPGDQAAQRFLERLAPSLDQCCQQLPEIAARLPHFQPMSFWLDALPNPLADRVFTGRQERFDADLQLLFDQLQVPLDPALLQRSNSSPPEPLLASAPSLLSGEIALSASDLSPAALAQLQAFYADDFRRFRYSLKPESEQR
jgi:hypothetical protein